MPAQKINNRPGGRRPGAGRPRDPESILGLRRRKLSLEVQRLEIDLAVQQKAKIDTDKAASVVATAFSACKSRLLAIAPAVAPVVAALDDAEEVRRVVQDAVEDALRELSADDLAG